MGQNKIPPLAFNGALYGPFGFSKDDGPSVCYSFYDLEQQLKKGYCFRRRSNSRPAIKRYLMVRDNGKCKYCKISLTYEEATVDHYFPPEMWLKSEIDLCDNIINLVLCCHWCNFVKGKKVPYDWVAYDRNDNRMRIRILKAGRRKITRLKLLMQGTMTIRGQHKGIAMYKAMNAAQARAARYARFKDDYRG